MKACGSYLKRKIISGDRLIFGLFLAGTGETNNPLGFPNISAALPAVEEIDVHTIRHVNELAKMDRNAFVAEFGHPVKDHKTEKPPLAGMEVMSWSFFVFYPSFIFAVYQHVSLFAGLIRDVSSFISSSEFLGQRSRALSGRSDVCYRSAADTNVYVYRHIYIYTYNRTAAYM